MSAASTTTAPAQSQNSVMSEFGRSKRCSKFVERLPLTRFRRQRAGRQGRHAECNRCRNLRESHQVAGKRRAVRRQELLSRLAKLTAMRSQRRLLALVNDTVAAFHGPERLAEEFRAMFDDARERGDMRTASHILLAIATLAEHTSSTLAIDTVAARSQTSERTTLPDARTARPVEPDFAQMTDRQLAARYRKLKREKGRNRG